MRTIALPLLTVSLFWLGATGTGAGDKKEGLDVTKLIGTWKYASGEKNGEKIAEDNLKKQTVMIDKETFTLTGDALFVMKYKVDASKKPATIEFEITKSPFGPGAKSSGVIELKADQIHLCYNPEGGPAPTKFETKGSKAHYFVLRREKK